MEVDSTASQASTYLPQNTAVLSSSAAPAAAIVPSASAPAAALQTGQTAQASAVQSAAQKTASTVTATGTITGAKTTNSGGILEFLFMPYQGASTNVSTPVSSPSSSPAPKPKTTPDTTPSPTAGFSTSTINLDADTFKKNVTTHISPDKDGNYHEEQLQHAVVTHLLDQISDKARTAYVRSYNTKTKAGMCEEDAVKQALTEVVQSGSLSMTDAKLVNGISFRAAQLDSNLEALYDNRGGKNDPTIAVMKKDRAIAQALSTLSDIKSGRVKVDPRSLDAPSNKVPGRSTAKAADKSGFLWKPVSDKNGKLAVLLPSALTGKISKLGIYSALPPSAENLIEEGNFSGDKENGGRAHYRFRHPGSYYPDDAYVVVYLKDGDIKVFRTGDSSKQSEQ